jgi:hydroxyacyl-ACP dehydratase HTD2-like protein with hotdog domain
MSDQAAAAGADHGEPPEDDRPPVDGVLDSLPLPAAGDPIAPLRCGASRLDLAGYAEASGDSNPIHLDHDAARAAGLGGVIVHGLLMAAWMARAAERHGRLDGIRLRFRNPLRPAVPALVTGTVSGVDPAAIDLVLSAGDERLVTGHASVTP